MPEKPGLVFYAFIVGDKYYCGKSGEGYYSPVLSERFQITVYDKNFKTPEWFKNSVMYQIFPDRFCGNSSIESHLELGFQATKHMFFDEEVMYLPFIDKQYYNPCDFFGGNIRGIISRLDYLQKLGINTIYLNPIFLSPSNHRYDTSDYMMIDTILGTFDDLKELCEKINVILDGVFSHTGDDSIYFDRYKRFNTQRKDWYIKDKYWWGFKSLPEVDEDNEDYRNFIKSVVSHWADAGIKGWRLDVADELTDEFIKMFRNHLKSLGDNVLIGEVWENATNKISYGHRRTYSDGDSLDSVMNYPLLNYIIDFMNGEINAYEFKNKTMELIESYPKPMLDSLMNILSTHDTRRSITALSKNKIVSHETFLKQMSAAMIQFFMPGVPCIYYGDEVGLEGEKDPFNRRPYPYGRENMELLNFYKKLCSVHRKISGACCVIAVNDDVIAAKRNNFLIVINSSGIKQSITFYGDDFNEGDNVERIKLLTEYANIFTDGRVICYNNSIELTLEAYEGVMLEGKVCSMADTDLIS